MNMKNEKDRRKNDEARLLISSHWVYESATNGNRSNRGIVG